jgi:hypothetical protein
MRASYRGSTTGLCQSAGHVLRLAETERPPGCLVLEVDDEEVAPFHPHWSHVLRNARVERLLRLNGATGLREDVHDNRALAPEPQARIFRNNLARGVPCDDLKPVAFRDRELLNDRPMHRGSNRLSLGSTAIVGHINSNQWHFPHLLSSCTLY